MCPESMHSTSYSESSNSVGDDPPNNGHHFEFEGDLEQGKDRYDVKQGQRDRIIQLDGLRYRKETPHFVRFFWWIKEVQVTLWSATILLFRCHFTFIVSKGKRWIPIHTKLDEYKISKHLIKYCLGISKEHSHFWCHFLFGQVN